MPERRAGLDPQRAEELEQLLEDQFAAMGLGRKTEPEHYSAGDFIDFRLQSQPQSSAEEVLNVYMDALNNPTRLRLQIGLVWGELYGAGDLSQLKSSAETLNTAKVTVHGGFRKRS